MEGRDREESQKEEAREAETWRPSSGGRLGRGGELYLWLTAPVFPYPDTEGCDHTWRKFHGHCYRYFSRRHTWEDAEKDCREHNGHLASIHSPAEQSFIRGERGRELKTEGPFHL